mmetsp:Transcript_9710/g.21617  ORF Transcript_9710/g.21617 Transcript_9710/m.21617 type:complete len:215 (-) Transcript_9710:551-1195(-)
MFASSFHTFGIHLCTNCILLFYRVCNIMRPQHPIHPRVCSRCTDTYAPLCTHFCKLQKTGPRRRSIHMNHAVQVQHYKMRPRPMLPPHRRMLFPHLLLPPLGRRPHPRRRLGLGRPRSHHPGAGHDRHPLPLLLRRPYLQGGGQLFQQLQGRPKEDGPLHLEGDDLRVFSVVAVVLEHLPLLGGPDRAGAARDSGEAGDPGGGDDVVYDGHAHA